MSVPVFNRKKSKPTAIMVVQIEAQTKFLSYAPKFGVEHFDF